MDLKRVAIAAVAAWVVDSVYAVVVWMGILGGEMARFPMVFRPEADMGAYLPLMFAGGLLGIFALVYVYAKGYEGGSGMAEGFRFGLLMAVFMTGFVSIAIYGTFNIDGQLGLLASTASFAEMLLVGTVIGVAYKPATSPVAAPAKA